MDSDCNTIKAETHCPSMHYYLGVTERVKVTIWKKYGKTYKDMKEYIR